MNNVENENDENDRNKKWTKSWIFIWTVIYILFFPFSVIGGFISMIVFDNPSISVLKGLSTVFAIFLIPLSLIVSVYFMWSSYKKEKYDKALIYWSIPWGIFIFVLYFNVVLYKGFPL